MRDFFEKHSNSWFVFFCLAAIAAILACNLWSLWVGQCAIHDFLRIPLIGWVLILANVIAGMILYFVKHRNRLKFDGSFCPECRTNLRDQWGYCPNCGSDITQSLHSRSTL